MSLLPLPIKAINTQATPRPKSRVSQTRNAWDSQVYETFDAYVPFRFNYDMYNLIRESIPMASEAIRKYKLLIGGFEIDCKGNRQAQEICDKILYNVKLNSFDSGFSGWLEQLIDSALVYGGGLGEVIPNMGLTDIARLKNAPVKHMRFMRDEKNPDQLVFGQMTKEGFVPIRLKDQDLIHYLAFDKREGHPQGYSLFASLPFVSRLIMIIWNCVKNIMLRTGDPTYVFFFDSGKDAEYEEVRDAVAKVEDSVSDVMEKRMMGGFGDIFGASAPDSKISCHVLGSDIRFPPIEISHRTILEQLVAATGFPPFMFGVNWATTERLSTHQNDMIINHINNMRLKGLDPIIEKVFTQALLFNGITNPKFDWTWQAVNLMDEIEKAKAEAEEAKAERDRVEYRLQLIDYGALQMESFVEWLVEEGIEKEENVKKAGILKIVEAAQKRGDYVRIKRIWEGLKEA